MLNPATFKLFLSLSAVTAVAQIVPPGGEVGGMAASIEHVTLVGVLLTGLVALWRKNEKKDEQNERQDERLQALQKTTSESLTVTTDALRELRATMSEMTAAIIARQD